MGLPFQDRTEAGRLLAGALESYARRPSTIVLGIPRGGVVVAYEVAHSLELPLDIFVVRKLGVPGQEELAMGAVAGGGFYLLNQDVVDQLQISESAIQSTLQKEQKELRRRERVYRQGRRPFDLHGQTLLLVDDGLATGSSVRAAIRMLKRQRPTKIVLSVPVAPVDTVESLRKEVTEVICLETPEPFYGIGAWYKEFSPTSDQVVCDLLTRANAHSLRPAA